jgi:hypothetical protein
MQYRGLTVNPLAWFLFMDRPRFTLSNIDRTRRFETSIIKISTYTSFFPLQFWYLEHCSGVTNKTNFCSQKSEQNSSATH